MSWQQFLHLPLEQIGSYLGGVFSPLAFLWLVIGFFIQQQEIQENAESIRIQSQHTNLDNFLKMADVIYKHLGVISGFLYLSCREEMEAVLEEPLNIDDLWARAGTGDTALFARSIFRYKFDTNGNLRDMKKIFHSTPIRQRHTANYKNVFENLLGNAKLCDSTDDLENALLNGTAWGLLYKAIIEEESEPKNAAIAADATPPKES